MNFRLCAGVIKCWIALKVERNSATDDSHPADELVRRGSRDAYRHVILDFANSVCMQESRDEDIGFRPIELLVAEIIACRSNLESPAFLVVEDGGEYTRRVKSREAKPIDRAVHADQGCCPHVTDDTVVLDRLITGPHLSTFAEDNSLALLDATRSPEYILAFAILETKDEKRFSLDA
jgi:hypothetical protein